MLLWIVPERACVCVCTQAHDHEGFFIITALVENVPLSAYEPQLPTVFQLIFTRYARSLRLTSLHACIYVVKLLDAWLAEDVLRVLC